MKKRQDEQAAGYPIGGLSVRTGCPVETIRYYEKSGLLPKPPRTRGNHRLYSHDQVERLRFIRRARELGFTLDEVRELLSLVDGGRYTCGEVLALATRHLADVRQKIDDLRRLEESLVVLLAECHGGTVPECPIIDNLFGGAGARPQRA